ncbi:MAG: c-type cytochrome domain-containing protein [Pirellulales bacterium]
MASITQAAPPALDFNRDIRPILSENCFYCHGQDGNKRQVELRLDVREIAVDAGAIVPNDAASSELIRRINSDDPDEVMPPPSSNRRLSPQQKKLLERWIGEGAVYAPHWAFVAPTRPLQPDVQHPDRVRTPIDRPVDRRHARDRKGHLISSQKTLFLKY